MYAGKLVELGTTDQVFHEPQMPYSIGLLRSVPNMLTAGTHRLVPLDVLTRIVVDVGEASGVELELSSSAARTHGGFSCPTLMPGSLRPAG